MAINRNRDNSNSTNDRQGDRKDGSSADPKQSKVNGSLIWTVTRFIENAFSHRGMFWLGVSVALIAFFFNAWFYAGVLEGLASVAPIVAIPGGIGIAFATSLFEVMPLVWTRSHRMMLEQIFSAGAKPTDLPELNNKAVGDADQLMEDYRNSDRKTRNFFKTARWVTIAFETFMGVMFLGRVGAGAGALMKLLGFVASIFGVEWGVSLALRAAQFELPPQIREQLNFLIANSGKALNLKKIS